MTQSFIMGVGAFIVALLMIPHPSWAENSLTANRELIGTALDVRFIDLTEAQHPGKSVYKSLSGCVKQDKAYKGEGYNDIREWWTIDAFYGYLSNKTNISGNLKGKYTMGATVDALYESTQENEYQASGVAVEILSLKKKYYLDSTCETNKPLNSELSGDFKALPPVIGNPAEQDSWTNYRNFFKKHGTHYVNRVMTGARFQMFEFSKSVSEEDRWKIKAKACLDMEGPTQSGEASVSGCNEYTQEKRREASSFDANKKRRVAGGNEKARIAIEAGEPVTPDLLKRFLSGADGNSDGVRYQLRPLSDLFAMRNPGRDDQNRINNMQAFLEGFLAFDCNQSYGCGCSLKTDGKETLRSFKLVSKKGEHNRYACQRPHNGCKAFNDCRGGGAIGAVCYCYGKSCIDTASDKISAVVRHKQKGSYDKGVNTSCNFDKKLTKLNCKCDGSGKKIVNLWEQKFE